MFFNLIGMMVFESVFQLSMAGLIYLESPGELLSLQKEYQTSSLVFSQITGFLCIFFSLFVMPLTVITLLCTKSNVLKSFEIKKRFGFLYESLRSNEMMSMLYNCVFVFRRIIISISSLYMADLSSLQLMLLVITNMLTMVYIGNYLPFKLHEQNREELRFEFLVGNITLLMFTFTDFCPDPEQKYRVGWAYNSLIIIGVVYKMSKMVFLVLYQIKLRLIKFFNELNCFKSKTKTP